MGNNKDNKKYEAIEIYYKNIQFPHKIMLFFILTILLMVIVWTHQLQTHKMKWSIKHKIQLFIIFVFYASAKTHGIEVKGWEMCIRRRWMIWLLKSEKVHLWSCIHVTEIIYLPIFIPYVWQPKNKNSSLQVIYFLCSWTTNYTLKSVVLRS